MISEATAVCLKVSKVSPGTLQRPDFSGARERDMGDAKEFGREILVMGVLSSDPGLDRSVLDALESEFGPIREKTDAGEFCWTDYYVPEMGSIIYRYYIEFESMIDPACLAGTKLWTNALERKLSVEGRRRINLDPGLLAPGRFVLATTKDRAHRIALSDGIYAELTLIYEKKQFHPLPWTYPDWASAPVRTMLAAWRTRLFHRDSD
jgi:hypothetical protein